MWPFVMDMSNAVDNVDGSSGTDARAVNLTAAAMGFSYNQAGTTPAPSTSVVTATNVIAVKRIINVFIVYLNLV